MKTLSSRPEPARPPTPFSLEDLTPAELELVAALLYNTKLGQGISIYRDAAYSLGSKIDKYTGNTSFAETASMNVNVEINVLDDLGYIEDVYDNNHFEIVV